MSSKLVFGRLQDVNPESGELFQLNASRLFGDQELHGRNPLESESTPGHRLEQISKQKDLTGILANIAHWIQPIEFK